jgi:hypothetical protein
MLRYIICRLTPQEVDNILNQSFVLHKELIKNNKMNNITPMKIDIDVAHVHLVTKNKIK